MPANAESARDSGSIPRVGRSPAVGNGAPLQYSCLENTWREEPEGLQGHNVSNTTEHACIPPVLTELTGETTDTKSKNHTDKYKRLVRPELLKSAISVLRTPEWEPASEGMLALKRSSVAARQKNGLAQRHCWVRG